MFIAKQRIQSETAVRLAGWREPVERLRQALEGDELTLYCQPIVALTGGTGFPMAEVLVRLRQEEEALMPPGEFLPLFEQHGLMPELDRWVVRHAIRHLSNGSRIPRLSVNLSSQTLDDPAFAGSVAQELVAAGVPGTALLFEIDEADSLQQCGATERFARAIRTVGCGLTLDGFGRRPASFAALKALAVELVKIDGSLVRRLLTDDAAERKVRAIQTVGDSLGFKLVAEMVEDQDILLRLKALGIAYAQGYGVCQPHPIERIANGAAA